MSGPLTLSGNATLPLHAVPLQQLTAATAGGPFLSLATGGTVAGDTTFAAKLMVTGPYLQVGTNAGTPGSLYINAPVANQANLFFQSAGLLTWQLIRDASPTAGNNSGQYLSAYSYTDTGAFKGTLFTGARGSGGTGDGGPFWLNFSPRVLKTTRATAPNGVYGDEENLITDQQPTSTLGANPIATVNGSATVTITWAKSTAANSPLDITTGEAWVKFAGMTAFNGVNLNTGGFGGNGWYKVQTITAPDTFTITYDTTATGTGTGGGAACTVRPSSATTFHKRFTTARTNACGYPIQRSESYSAWPEFYQTAPTGTVPDYEQWYTEFFTPPEASGNYLYHSIQWESDFINRGKDGGYSPNLFGTNNSTIGIWFQALANLLSRGAEGGTPTNWNTVIAFGSNANTATNLRVASYNLINAGPNATVGKGHDPTGHGGVSFDMFGSYQFLPFSPFATTTGTSTITVTLGGFEAAGLVNGDSVYIPTVYTFAGVTFGGGSYTIANVNVAAGTFTITGTGSASSSGSFGGNGQSLYFDKRSPFAPVQFTGQYRHGLYTAPDSRFEDGLVIHARPGQGIGWDDGTGIASITASASSAGNVSVVATPAGTGTVTLAGPATANGLLTATSGLSFGTQTPSSGIDLSKHLALYGTTYGLNIGSFSVQVVAVGAVVGTFTATGLNATAIGATTPATAAFTTVRINGNVGFYNTSPVAKPTVSGAKGSNAALGSLIAALVSQGLITDTTTA